MVKKKINKKQPKLSLRAPIVSDDLKTAVLLVSVTINVAFFIAWLALRITTKYDQQVFNFLFTR